LGATDHTDGDPPRFGNLLAEARGDDPPLTNGGEKGVAEKKHVMVVCVQYALPYYMNERSEQNGHHYFEQVTPFL
jgi:hypothetical protein